VSEEEEKVAWRILDGFRLSPHEFEKAKEWKLLLSPATYGEYVAQFYEDDIQRGFLCPEPLFKGMSEQPGGQAVKVDTCVHLFLPTVHAFQVKKEYLTPWQLEWFKQHGWTEDQIGSGNPYELPKKRAGEYLKNFKMSEKWFQWVDESARRNYIQHNYEHGYLNGDQPLSWMVELVRASQLRGDLLKSTLEWVEKGPGVRNSNELLAKGKQLKDELTKLGYLDQS
jgi:hypothetical protein